MQETPRIGTEFAGYRIGGLLGRGGMSVVYWAEHARLGSKVALKLMSPELAENETFRERFVRESRVAASMSHPNIIPIYDAGDWDGILYIAMRHVEGSDLSAMMKREGALPVMRTLSIISQVGGALDAAHARGLVHRDVKPANVLLESTGDEDSAYHAYLSDFGLTKRTLSEGGLTGTGQTLGTVDYMAPEQIEGKPVDGRTDLYALACVLYECLAGRAPFERDENVAVIWAHLRDDPPSITAWRPKLPSGVDAVIAKALAKSPDDRYSSCKELVAAMRGELDAAGERPPSLRPEPLSIPEGARPTVAAQPTPEEPPSPPVSEPRAVARDGVRRGLRSNVALIAVAAALLGGGVAAAAALLLGGDGEEATPGATPTETAATSPAGTTTGAVSEGPLLATLVPPELWENCTLQNVPLAGALETAVCLPAETRLAPNRWEVSVFETEDGMLDAYNAEVQRAREARDRGKCSRASWGGEGKWEHAPDKPGGRRVCSFEGDNAVIAWIHEQLGQENHQPVLGTAEKGGLAHAQLFIWWNNWVHFIGKQPE